MNAHFEEDTKKLILKTAYKLFAEFGYEQTPISLIMERSGKSKATFYAHYKRKEDIMLEIIDLQMYRNFHFIEETALPYMEQENFQILTFFEAFFKIGLELDDRKEWTLVYNDLIRLSVKDDAIRDKLSKVHDGWIDLFEKAIARGIDTNQLPEDVDTNAIIKTILALYEGAHLERVYGGGPDHEQIRYLLKRVVHHT